MVERDGSNVCQQNSKKHETKKQNHNHQTNNLPGSEETDKNNRKQYPENLQFYNLNKSCDNKEILTKRIQKEDHYRIK